MLGSLEGMNGEASDTLTEREIERVRAPYTHILGH